MSKLNSCGRVTATKKATSSTESAGLKEEARLVLFWFSDASQWTYPRKAYHLSRLTGLQNTFCKDLFAKFCLDRLWLSAF